MASHVFVDDDGRIHARTPEGRLLISAMRLDREDLTRYREKLFEILRLIEAADTAVEGTADIKDWLGFPANLPDLAALHPPDGNRRPKGIANSYYELRARGELPDVY